MTLADFFDDDDDFDAFSEVLVDGRDRSGLDGFLECSSVQVDTSYSARYPYVKVAALWNTTIDPIL